MSEAKSKIAQRMAELLISEIEAAANREEFGVIARDISPLDRSHFLKCLPGLFGKSGKKLRISLVHETELVAAFQDAYPKYADLVASASKCHIKCISCIHIIFRQTSAYADTDTDTYRKFHIFTDFSHLIQYIKLFTDILCKISNILSCLVISPN